MRIDLKYNLKYFYFNGLKKKTAQHTKGTPFFYVIIHKLYKEQLSWDSKWSIEHLCA